MSKKMFVNAILTDLERINDCLTGIEAIQMQNSDEYNEVIFCLIEKARDIIETSIIDIKLIKGKK